MKQFLVLSIVALKLLGLVAAVRCEAAAVTAPGLASQGVGRLQAVLTTSELVVGQNRVAFGLLKGHRLLDAADVVVHVYELHGQQGHLEAQVRAPYARLEVVEED